MKTPALALTWIITSVVLVAIMMLFHSNPSWRTFLLVLGIVLAVTFMLRRFSPLKPNYQFAVFGIMTDIGLEVARLFSKKMDKRTTSMLGLYFVCE